MIFIITDDFEDQLTESIIDKLHYKRVPFILFSFEKNSSRKEKRICNREEHDKLVHDVINPILNNELPLLSGILFLFGFKQGIDRSKTEYHFASSVRSLNLPRLFYNRRSIEGCYFITDDFYGIDLGREPNPFESKVNARFDLIASYKSNNDFLFEKGRVRNNFLLLMKNYLLSLSYYFILVPLLIFIPKKINKKDILFVIPKRNNWFLAKSGSTFINEINYIKLALGLKKNYNVRFCIHPQNQGSYFSLLLRLIRIPYITSLYSNEAKEIIETSPLSISVGSSAVMDLLNFNLLNIEIGRSNRVCSFRTNYHFIDETDLKINEICKKICDWDPPREDAPTLPYFSFVFFPKIINKSSVKDSIDEEEISSLVKFIGRKYEQK